MKMTDLFVFRHGETDWNRERRFQGHTDIPLNSLGLEQAQVLKEILSEHHPQIILTSDLMRARTTASVVNEKLNVPLLESAALRECRLGDPEGMERDKVIELYGADSWERWLSVKAEDHTFCYPNGESKEGHLKRLLNYLEDFCVSHPELQRIGVSTHGGSVRRLIHHCVGAPTEAVPLPNCVLYKISFRHSDRRWIFAGRVE